MKIEILKPIKIGGILRKVKDEISVPKNAGEIYIKNKFAKFLEDEKESEPEKEEDLKSTNEELTLQLTELSEQHETLTKANEELKAKIVELEKVKLVKKAK